MRKTISASLFRWMSGLLVLFLQSAVWAQSQCIETLEPVTEFLQQYDHSAQWQFFSAGEGRFSALEAALPQSKLAPALEVLDIDNEGALFMRMEWQSLWLFKIKQCLYSLIATPQNQQKVHLQLTIFIGESDNRMVGPEDWFDLPLLHHFSDHQTGEAFYAFEWLTDAAHDFEQALTRQLEIPQAQVRKCRERKLCILGHGGTHYLLSWIESDRQNVLLLFRQPCKRDCNVAF